MTRHLSSKASGGHCLIKIKYCTIFVWNRTTDQKRNSIFNIKDAETKEAQLKSNVVEKCNAPHLYGLKDSNPV